MFHIEHDITHNTFDRSIDRFDEENIQGVRRLNETEIREEHRGDQIQLIR